MGFDKMTRLFFKLTTNRSVSKSANLLYFIVKKNQTDDSCFLLKNWVTNTRQQVWNSHAINWEGCFLPKHPYTNPCIAHWKGQKINLKNGYQEAGTWDRGKMKRKHVSEDREWHPKTPDHLAGKKTWKEQWHQQIGPLLMGTKGNPVFELTILTSMWWPYANDVIFQCLHVLYWSNKGD